MKFEKFIILCLNILIQSSEEVYFERFIEAIASPYYKISFRLGTCQENLVYSEYKAWPVARMNRIFDIYYKSAINDVTVSSVEIKLVINNTDCVGFSERGVGFAEFSATLFFSTKMAVIFYSLSIYTCSHAFNKELALDEESPNLPFVTSPENEDED